jgi:hypothetical protein
MTDLDPEIWKNKTLGAANNLPFLDEVSAQIIENRNAKAEDREPENKEFRNRFSNETLVGHLVDVDGSPVNPVDYETELAMQTEEQDQKVDREDKHQKAVAAKEAKEEEDAKPVTPNRRTSSAKK